MIQPVGKSYSDEASSGLDERVSNLIANPDQLLELCERSIQSARSWYHHCNQPMANWKDGKVIWVDPVTLNEVERPSSIPVRQSDSSN